MSERQLAQVCGSAIKASVSMLLDAGWSLRRVRRAVALLIEWELRDRQDGTR